MSLRAEKERQQRIRLLVVVAVGLVLAWQTTIGSLLLYPLTLLATWFHEMGHGLVALATGADFDHLQINPDGSGVAHWQTLGEASRGQRALVAASGPLAPALAGAALIIASRNPGSTRAALFLLAAALLGSTVIWVRSLTGLIALPLLGLAIGALAWRGTAGQQRLGIQILGVQAGISAWRQFDYLFSAYASSGGRSDTGAIADALVLPYWVWGAAISVTMVGLLWGSLKIALRR
jgi:uncharacterized membrane protein